MTPDSPSPFSIPAHPRGHKESPLFHESDTPERTPVAFTWDEVNSGKWTAERWHLVDNVPGAQLSTVFLGMAVGVTWRMYPERAQFYETMLFPEDDTPEVLARYRTRAEAEAGHAEHLAHLRAAKVPDV